MNNPQSGSTLRRGWTRRGAIVHCSGGKFEILYQLIIGSGKETGTIP
ncbi:hypothetical protein [Noviherbaspirillum soli]|nr:hypothetical protein [Noviherbaspirillum soli]